jgi:hypothetical protein
MDPVTIVGFIASIVQLIDATSKVVKYLNSVADAPKDRVALAREASGLLPLLIDLRHRVEESRPTDPWYAGVRALGGDAGPLEQLRERLEKLARKLKPKGGVKKVGMALRWTLDKSDIDSNISGIERLKSLVNLSLQNDLLYDSKTLSYEKSDLLTYGLITLANYR